ncbi:MAG TPA: hypothetical protein VG502_17440 [Flexivirga sp.]|uniref:hypothetical protein n=1 Tax=Flexivirga sp. TaxID=1962927 RepID=UPI002BF8BDD2|nr:hypothetical protein [Flexivirga sp.]HWC24082.1 hypothetical protein [Flexivirga sp.]
MAARSEPPTRSDLVADGKPTDPVVRELPAMHDATVTRSELSGNRPAHRTGGRRATADAFTSSAVVDHSKILPD